jgi:hypothetical protein
MAIVCVEGLDKFTIFNDLMGIEHVNFPDMKESFTGVSI